MSIQEVQVHQIIIPPSCCYCEFLAGCISFACIEVSFAVRILFAARNHEILASQAPKIRKNYVPPVAYGRMTYQYIKGAAPALPAPAPGTGASSHLLDDI